MGNIEKLVIDLNTQFDNITKKFKTVSDEHRDTNEELVRVRQEILETKALLTEIEILTNNAAQHSSRECL